MFFLLILIIMMIIISGHFFLIRRQRYTFHWFYWLSVVIAARARRRQDDGWAAGLPQKKKKKMKKRFTPALQFTLYIYISLQASHSTHYIYTDVVSIYLYRSWRCGVEGRRHSQSRAGAVSPLFRLLISFARRHTTVLLALLLWP